MTGRRKSGRKSGPSGKKETPEKSRRSSRRRKKSESPEDSGSDGSGDTADSQPIDQDPLSLNRRDGGSNDANKEEESAGSDGAWQVRSENGNKGGIPKLKICLQRPPDMSSPTSDTLPSPRTRRSRRGAASPSSSRNDDEGEEETTASTSETADNEGEHRPSRGKKHADKKDKEEEVPERDETEEATKRLEEQESAARNLEEIERASREKEEIARKAREAERAKKIAEEKAQEEKKVKERADEERKLKEKAALEEIEKKKAEAVRAAKKEEEAKRREQEEKEARKKASEERERRRLSAEEKEKEARRKSVEEKEARRKSLEEKEARRKSFDRKEEEARKKALEEKEATRKALEEKEKETRKKALEEKEARRKSQEEKESRRKLQEEKEAKEKAKGEKANRLEEQEPNKKSTEKKDARQKEDKEQEAEVKKVNEKVEDKEKTEEPSQVIAEETMTRKKRSPSRDSSEERAKEAALRSRKPKRKGKEGSEEGEVVESPDREILFPSRTSGRIRTGGPTVTEESDEAKANHDSSAPAAVVRKRRWGSSGSNSIKKPAVSISTDVLKEIIPEAKPVALSEVQLSPEPEEVEDDGIGKRRRSGSDVQINSRPEKPRVNERRRRSVPSDESEKDYEEEAVESGGEEMIKKEAPTERNHINESFEEKPIQRELPQAVRKVLPPDPLAALTKQRSPSPPRFSTTNILYVTNLVRPFTVVQLRDLLARTGSIVPENGFWIDTIKSRCYVKYTTEEEAKETRHALHGVRWPASNPKQLSVDFGTEKAMKVAMEGGRPPVQRAPAPVPERRPLMDDRREERERERLVQERDRVREREPPRERKVSADFNDDRERKPRLVEREREDKSGRTVRKVTIPVREWDLGKAERGFSPPPPDIRRIGEGDVEDRRRREKDRGRRSSSYEPVRKLKKKEEPPPTKLLLDDLFRKTKASPCIYWLPLTSQQIAVREEMRRKHMEEHEKQIAEHRKRQDTKRRRPRSKSRSRSPKK